jgi:VWFA-related protein
VTALLALLAGALAAPGAAGAPQPPIFRSGVESVYVDVFVTRDGAPVPGLEARHFELEDNGRRQRPELVGVESLPLTTLLVFDTSDSVRGAKLEGLRAAAGAFLDGLRPLDEVGLLSFSEEVRWLARPTADKGTVRGALARLDAKGPTAVWDALSAAMTMLPTTSRALVVVFSDGEDNVSWLDAAQVRAQAARSNALVQIVGQAASSPYGEPAHVSDMREIAEATGGRFWAADSPARLAQAFRAIVEAMNARYVLRFDPGPEAKPGLHRIEVRLKGAKGDVRARQGYWRAP